LKPQFLNLALPRHLDRALRQTLRVRQREKKAQMKHLSALSVDLQTRRVYMTSTLHTASNSIICYQFLYFNTLISVDACGNSFLYNVYNSVSHALPSIFSFLLVLYFPSNIFMRASELKDLGLSMGKPRARSQTREARTPRARLTPNMTV